MKRPDGGPPLRIGVIGAGIAGLAAARTLQDQGHQVEVFEKSRGPGGRAATRRIGDIGFDHGAQYLTVRDEGFRRTVDAWRERGLLEVWHGSIGRAARGRVEAANDDDQERLVAVPGMNALGKHLAARLALRREVRVAPPEYADAHWHLRSEAGDGLGEFDALVVAVPSPQARPLLAPAAPHLADIAAGVAYAPAWAVMLALDGESAVPFDGLFFDEGPIAWAARNSSKPGRTGHTWVLHATPGWTHAHIDAPPQQAAEQLSAAFTAPTGLLSGTIAACVAHRWLYALVDEPLQVGALWDAGLRLAVCGDWCRGARIEDAFLSGQAAAGHLLRHLAVRGGRP